MKEKLEFKEAKGISKPGRSNGKHERTSEHPQVNGIIQQKHQPSFTNQTEHSKLGYPLQNSSPLKLKTESTQPHYNQQQFIHIMQLDFQATIRGYEIKMRNMTEEYRRNKQEMENKLKELFQQKTHWQNLAIRYSEQTQAEKGQEEVAAKQQQKINKLEAEKNLILKQKEDINKELQIIASENSQLKQRISELNKNQIKNSKYTSQPRTCRSLTPPPKNLDNPQQFPSNIGPQPSVKQLQMYKAACERMRCLVNDLNQDVIAHKLHRLNHKYAKEGSIIVNSNISQRSNNSFHKQPSTVYLSFNHSHSRHKHR